MRLLPPVPFIQAYLRKYVRPDSDILDIGCGPALYKQGLPGKYIGLDITDDPYLPDAPRIVDVVASATAIPLADERFDLVFSVAAFYQVDDPDKALREIKRVLKPSGRLILFDYNRRTQRKLAINEGTRPCWTQWGLKKRVVRAGFSDCEILPPTTKPSSGIVTLARLINTELRGSWAVVTGIKA